jgi:hypothetical protein
MKINWKTRSCGGRHFKIDVNTLTSVHLYSSPSKTGNLSKKKIDALMKIRPLLMLKYSDDNEESYLLNQLYMCLDIYIDVVSKSKALK